MTSSVRSAHCPVNSVTGLGMRSLLTAGSSLTPVGRPPGPVAAAIPHYHAPMPRRPSFSGFFETYGALLGLVLMIILGCIISPDAFARPLKFVKILLQYSFVSVIAIVMSFIVTPTS